MFLVLKFTISRFTVYYFLKLCKYSGMYALWLSCHVIGALLRVLSLNVSWLWSVFSLRHYLCLFNVLHSASYSIVMSVQSVTSRRTSILQIYFILTQTLLPWNQVAAQSRKHLPVRWPSPGRVGEASTRETVLWSPTVAMFFGILLIRYTSAAAGLAKFFWTAVWCGLGGVMGPILHCSLWRSNILDVLHCDLCQPVLWPRLLNRGHFVPSGNFHILLWCLFIYNRCMLFLYNAFMSFPWSHKDLFQSLLLFTAVWCHTEGGWFCSALLWAASTAPTVHACPDRKSVV